MFLFQKLERQKRRRPSSASSSEDETHIDQNPNIRLHQARIKRDELLGRLRVSSGIGHFVSFT